ncbi:hypothetical protein STFE110948_02145 [Streptobacillus felis]|uniref:Uncharacterized protein n=1 Tax=Streptobacillus felis TaxID=1384509 RepID=A0A7Z0TA27_9FUSO|nr:hypothetical protein [Streptobacillus felis]NYV27547.1 hypothetical protein [Streptobacillus felis]
MKKLLLFIALIGVISSPIELKKEVNVFEDEEIVKKYIDHLEGINIEDYSTYVNTSDLISEPSQPNNNVINPVFTEKLNVENLFIVSKNFDFDIKNLKDIIKKDLSTEISAKIEKSIFDLSKDSTSIDALFFDGNNNLVKFNNFKKDLIDFANEKVKVYGDLVKGEFINIENNTKVYNNVIELELE